MSLSTNAAPPKPEELAALLRLLDDETPEVRAQIAERFSLCGGDISEWLSTHPYVLNSREKKVLISLLSPPRREILEREWIAPTGGASALSEDWESFEAILRIISDFLHDGITVRQPLSDALDLLAEEAEESGILSARELRNFLFTSGRLKGNHDDYENPNNSDLAWSIAEGRSNPIGLSVVYILVGRRMGYEVEPVNFPGHFLCRIYEEGYPIIIDCFDNGQLHLQSTLLESPTLKREERAILRQASDPGTVLLRLLNNLVIALEEAGRKEDALLVRKLRATLK